MYAIRSYYVCDIEQEKDGCSDICDHLKSKSLTKYTPLILVSSYEYMEGIIGGLHSGAEDYVIKPIIANELLARIDAHLSESTGRMSSAVWAYRRRNNFV